MSAVLSDQSPPVNPAAGAVESPQVPGVVPPIAASTSAPPAGPTTVVSASVPSVLAAYETSFQHSSFTDLGLPASPWFGQDRTYFQHSATSWHAVVPGDVLIDNAHPMREVASIRTTGAESSFEVTFATPDGKGGVALTTEQVTDRFLSQHDVRVISRLNGAGVHAEFSVGAVEMAQIRETAIRSTLDQLVNRSLAICDDLSAAVGDPQYGQPALRMLHHYQRSLKLFKAELEGMDLDTMSAVSRLQARDESPALSIYDSVGYGRGAEGGRRPNVESLSFLRDFSNGLESSLGASESERPDGTASLQSRASVLVNRWGLLNAFRTAISEQLQGAPKSEVTTEFYRDAVPNAVLDQLSALVMADHVRPKSKELASRGIVFNMYSADEFREAIDRGAHLLVTRGKDAPESVTGFMLYYPPNADLPGSLRHLPKAARNQSAAVVDLVYVSPEASKQTFNHLFFGHRFSLQTTSDAQVHVGELYGRNRSSFSAITGRTGVPSPGYNPDRSDWIPMIVPIDVTRWKPENPQVPDRDQFLKRQTEIAERLAKRAEADVTPATVTAMARELDTPIHVRVPDWPENFRPVNYEHISRVILDGLREFSGVITGPAVREIERAGDGFRDRSEPTVSRILRDLRSSGTPGVHVGIFGADRDNLRYGTFGGISGDTEVLQRSERDGKISVEDASCPNRLKVLVNGAGEVASGEIAEILGISAELAKPSAKHPDGILNVMIAPLVDPLGNMELQRWAALAKDSPHHRIILIEDPSVGSSTRMGIFEDDPRFLVVRSAAELALVLNSLNRSAAAS